MSTFCRNSSMRKCRNCTFIRTVRHSKSSLTASNALPWRKMSHVADVRGLSLVAVPVWLCVHVGSLWQVRALPTWGPSCHSNATVHRHPHLHARALCSLLPLTGTPTYAQKSRGGHPSCDLAPLTTSFGTVGQWERRHLAMAGSKTLHQPHHALPPVTTTPCLASSSTVRRGVRVANRHAASWSVKEELLKHSGLPCCGRCVLVGWYAVFTERPKRLHFEDTGFDHDSLSHP